jgi:hypothetical protein
MAGEMMTLGYPAYVMTILGIAKLLGVGALLIPGRPLLKEWAYAGFTFNMLGATASHLFVGDPMSETLPPLVLLCLGAVSYQLRPASRRLAAAPILGGNTDGNTSAPEAARADASGRTA